MGTALATETDYELLIGPVATGDEAKLDYMLMVASSLVVGVAPGLLSWWNYDPANPPLDPDTGLPLPDPFPAPEPAVLVTCQTAQNLMLPTGSTGGRIMMERVGEAATTYAPVSDTEFLLPTAWRSLLRPWRAPEIASIRLSVPHPLMYTRGGWGPDWWWTPDSDDDWIDWNDPWAPQPSPS
jgi:hypothetical protein